MRPVCTTNPDLAPGRPTLEDDGHDRWIRANPLRGTSRAGDRRRIRDGPGGVGERLAAEGAGSTGSTSTSTRWPRRPSSSPTPAARWRPARVTSPSRPDGPRHGRRVRRGARPARCARQHRRDPRAEHFTEVTEAQYRQMMGVNIDGYFFMAEAAIPHLLETGGNIVNLASNAGLMGQAYTVVYCMSKGAVVQFTRTLAIEYIKTPLRVNTLAPSGVETPLATGFPDAGGCRHRADDARASSGSGRWRSPPRSRPCSRSSRRTTHATSTARSSRPTAGSPPADTSTSGHPRRSRPSTSPLVGTPVPAVTTHVLDARRPG